MLFIKKYTRQRPAPRPPWPEAPPKGSFAGFRPRALAASLVLCCCLGAACSQENAEKSPSSPEVAPTDVFSKRAPKPPRPNLRKILVVGDSLSISLGEQMERALSGAAGIDFARNGTRSSGLTRPELVDWPTHLRELVARACPDVVVIMLGANDVMPVEGPDGGRVYFESPGWPTAYAAKASELIAICRQANPQASIYWVGIPAMGEASLASGAIQVNAAIAALCAATPGCRFIDTKPAFSDPAGRFSRHARDAATGDIVPIRTGDGVHMTDGGAKLLAGVVLRTLADQEKLPPVAGVDELRAFARDLRPVQEEEPQPTRETLSKAKPSGKIYAVRQGDTVLTIARHLGINAKDLMAVNPGVDSKRLSLGQTLRIPAKKR
ncbi:MAG: DUF459 domain-containing protein [Solidesulfovibrio sp.]